MDVREMEPVNNARMKWLCRAQSWELLVASRVKVILPFGEFCCLNIQSTVPGWWSTDDLGGASFKNRERIQGQDDSQKLPQAWPAACVCTCVCVFECTHAHMHVCVR